MSDVIQPSTTINRESNVGIVPRQQNPQGAATKNSLKEIYATIASELQQVESTIVRELHSDAPEVETLLSHSRELGGKRLRPALPLLLSLIHI